MFFLIFIQEKGLIIDPLFTVYAENSIRGRPCTVVTGPEVISLVWPNGNIRTLQ